MNSLSTPVITRRLMLKRTFVASISPGIFLKTRKASARSKHVIIIGAGLSGLVAGYELMRAGHKVSILEAQGRTGGRVLTLRAPFLDGMYADAGAARIHNSHNLTLGYAHHFGLVMDPFYDTMNSYTSSMGGSPTEVGWDGFSAAVKAHRNKDLGQPSEWSKVSGGNDRLPHAFESQLGQTVLYNAAALQIDQDKNEVTVTFNHSGSQQSLSGDFLICAVPYSVLGDIRITPALPDRYSQIVKELERYKPASRSFCQFNQRFWIDRGTNGFAVTRDSEIWPSSFMQQGERGILQVYIWNKEAEKLTALSDEKRIQSTLNRLEIVYPGCRKFFNSGASVCWQDDPWVKGGWVKPNKISLQEKAAPQGRIYFAGDHISNWRSWMQGALESGLSAAMRIHVL